MLLATRFNLLIRCVITINKKEDGVYAILSCICYDIVLVVGILSGLDESLWQIQTVQMRNKFL